MSSYQRSLAKHLHDELKSENVSEEFLLTLIKSHNHVNQHEVDDFIEGSLKTPKPTQLRIAKVMHSIIERRFKYSDNKWCNECLESVDDIEVKKFLRTTIFEKYDEYQRKLSEEFDQAINRQNNETARLIQERMKKIWKIIEFIEKEKNFSTCIEITKSLF